MRMGPMTVAFVVAALAGMACQPVAKPELAGQTPTTAPAVAPKARLTLAQLEPTVRIPPNPPAAPKLHERARPLVEKAEAQLAIRSYIKAIELLEQAKGFAPKNPRLLKDLGLAYASLGDMAKARTNLLASLAKAPDDIRLRLILAQYAVLDKQYDKAILRLREGLACTNATEANPDTAECLWRLGRLLEAKGYLTASLECYRKVSRLVREHARAYSDRPLLRRLVNRPEECLVDQGRVLLALQKIPQAARILERAWRRDKAHPQAGLLAFKALLASKQYDRAQAIVMEMLSDSSQHARAIELARGLFRAQRDPALPEELVKAYLDRGGKDMVFVIAMAEAVADLGARERAAEMLSRYVKPVMGNQRVAHRLVRLHARTGDLAGAGRQLARMLAEEDANFAQIATGIRYLAGQGATADLSVKLAAAAREQEGADRHALLCVAGSLAQAVGDRKLAVSLLRQAIQEGVRFWPAYEALADVYVAAENYDALDGLGRRVGKVAGDSYFKHYFLGRIAYDRGRTGEAVANLEEALARREGSAAILKLLGQALVRRRQFEEAQRRLAAALDLAPDDLTIVRSLAEVYVVRRRPADANRVVGDFLQRNPGDVPGRALAATLLAQQGRADQAKAHLAKLLAEAPDNVDVRLLELELAVPSSLDGAPIPADQARAAFAVIRRVLSLTPGNLRARTLQASLLANQKRYAEAAEAWKSVFDRNMQDVSVVEGYLAALIQADKKQEVSQAVRQAAQGEGLGTPLRLALLDKLLQIRDFTLAEEFIEKWLGGYDRQQEPDTFGQFRLRQEALKVYAETKNFDKAQRLLDRWIASLADEQMLSVLRGEKLRMYGKAEEFDQAVRYAKQWQGNEPTSERPRAALMLVLMEGKQYAKAHAVVDEWLDDAKGPEQTGRLRGSKLWIFRREGKAKELLQYGKRWIADDPDDAAANIAVVSELMELKQYGPAHKLAEDWLARLAKRATATTAPADKRVVVELSLARYLVIQPLLDAERNDEALKRARAFVAAEPENSRVLNLLVMVLKKLRKDDEVLSVLERMYRLDPDDAMINNDLGYTWADMGIHLDRAEQMIRKALVAVPDSIAVMDSFGWVLYKQGRFAAAKGVFDRLLKQGENRDDELHAIILDHAGDTCWRLGQSAQAIELWVRAVATAKKDKQGGAETKKVLTETPAKISAVREAKQPKVAPSGKPAPR